MTPKEVMEKATAAWNAGDRDGWMALCSTDADLADAGTGQEGWGQIWDGGHVGFPDSRFQIVQTIEEGERIAFVLRFTGTHTGIHRTQDRILAPTGELAPTGRYIEFDCCQVGQVRGDKVIALRGFGVVEGFSALSEARAPA